MDARIKILIGSLIGGGLGYLAGTLIVENLFPEDDLWVEEEVKFEVLSNGEPLEVKKKHIRVNDHKADDITRLGKSSAPIRDYTAYHQPALAALAAKYNGETVEPDLPNENDLPEFKEFENAEFDLNPAIYNVEKDPIRIISLTEFINDDSGWKKTTLNYYEDDDIVTDDLDNPIVSPETILGEEALVAFGILSDDEDVVYVLNENEKGLYEVVRLHRAYSVTAQKPKVLSRAQQRINQRRDKANRKEMGFVKEEDEQQ